MAGTNARSITGGAVHSKQPVKQGRCDGETMNGAESVMR